MADTLCAGQRVELTIDPKTKWFPREDDLPWPALGGIYTVREVAADLKGFENYIRLAELAYPSELHPVNGKFYEVAFPPHIFRRVVLEVDYSDVLNPRARWVAEKPRR